MAANGLFAGAGQGSDLEGLEVYHPYGVVLGVGDVEAGPVEGGALRVVEVGLRRGAVLQAALSASDDRFYLAVQVSPDYAVVVGVGDEQAMFGGENLSREGNRAVSFRFALASEG